MCGWNMTILLFFPARGSLFTFYMLEVAPTAKPILMRHNTNSKQIPKLAANPSSPLRATGDIKIFRKDIKILKIVRPLLGSDPCRIQSNLNSIAFGRPPKLRKVGK